MCPLIFQLSLVLLSVPFCLYSSFCCQPPWIFCCGIPTVVKNPSSRDVSTGCGLPLVVGVPCCSSCLLCCLLSGLLLMCYYRCCLSHMSLQWLKYLLLLPSLLLLRSLLLLVFSMFMAVPAVVGLPAVVGFLAVVASLLLLASSYCWCISRCWCTAVAGNPNGGQPIVFL